MLSKRGNHLVRNVVPKLIEDHGPLPPSKGIKSIDLSTAENKLMIDRTLQYVTNGVSQMKPDDLYLRSNEIGGSVACREVMALFFNQHLHPSDEIQAQHIVVTPGASTALDALICNICNPGEGVLIPTPYWSGLDISVSIQNKARTIRVNIPLSQVFDLSVIELYRQALQSSSVPIRALLITNPHNPLGKCYPKEVLEATIQFCVENGLHYISDELYATSIYQDEDEWVRDGEGAYHPFRSVLSLVSSESPAVKLVHVVYSLSKDFGASGLRLGALITQSNADLRMACSLVTHAKVSSLTSAAAISLLSISTVSSFIKENSKRIRASYDKMRNWLSVRKIQFRPAYAGLYVFARLCKSENPDDEKKLEQEISKHSVRVVRGLNYFCHEAGWFRLVFTIEPDLLDEGLRRLDRVLNLRKRT